MAAPKRRRFQLTSLPSEEKQRLAGYIKQLGGTFIDSQIFFKQATHVICGKANRGEKYLGGCALGKWVLQKEFVEDSYKQGSWLNEEKYEWTSNILDGTEADTKLVSLYDAPKKWRLALQNTKAGAFKSWNAIVHVQDNKMKKAYERLLEAGDASICKKKISFQDLSSLPKDVTHFFVETKLRGDFLHWESQEIGVHSPDFIPEYLIKGPKETFVSSNMIMKYNNLMNAYKMPRISEIKKTAGILPGKENGVTVDVKGKEVSGKRGVKRLTTDCDLCVAKKQKTMNDLPPYINMNSSTDVQKVQHLTFPGYVSNIVESCMDEECVNLGMESLTSSLSSQQVPTSEWLHIIMNHFLLNAASEEQAFQSYHLLQNILDLHPPVSVSCQSLYLEALAEPINNNSQNNEMSTPWEFISKVIRNSLGNQGNEKIDRMQSNAHLLLKFIDNLLKLDGCNVGQSSSIITCILWPSDSICQTNREIKEFVTLCCEAVKLAVDGDSKSFICHILLDWLSMAVTLKKRDDVNSCEFLAQQLFMEISKTDSHDVIKLLLQGCHSSWLKIRILELILENFDKQLIPQESKQLLNKTLKLSKIVLCYFFLVPNTKGTEEMNEMVEKAVTRRGRRRNGKGETPLHLACIHNDATKVEEILKEKDLDVNTTDNAGWTALHEACNRGYVQCVKKILQYHEKTNKVNLLACPDDGVTVLHDAVLNNHLNVVKLLTQVGGLDLLQAKTALGKTAIQLAKTNAMTQFINSELNKTQSVHDQENIPRPPEEEAYDKVLSRKRRKYYIPIKECEKYLFYVSLLVQVYIREHSNFVLNGKKYCTNCINDTECVKKFPQHLAHLERHVKLLSGKQHLSQLCQLYMTSMKLCISYVNPEDSL